MLKLYTIIQAYSEHRDFITTVKAKSVSDGVNTFEDLYQRIKELEAKLNGSPELYGARKE